MELHYGRRSRETTDQAEWTTQEVGKKQASSFIQVPHISLVWPSNQEDLIQALLFLVSIVWGPVLVTLSLRRLTIIALYLVMSVQGGCEIFMLTREQICIP